jgi:hypothetical protein
MRSKYFIDVKVLSARFRDLFLRDLREAFDTGKLEFHGKQQHLEDRAQFERWFKTIPRKWVVYAKKPFGGPGQALKYVGRYTHKTAITNYRIADVSPTKVSFWRKDYSQGGAQKLMGLHPHEFMHRLLLHVLPPGFVRIRYGGFLSNRQRAANIARCLELIQQRAQKPRSVKTRLGIV